MSQESQNLKKLVEELEDIEEVDDLLAEKPGKKEEKGKKRVVRRSSDSDNS